MKTPEKQSPTTYHDVKTALDRVTRMRRQSAEGRKREREAAQALYLASVTSAGEERQRLLDLASVAVEQALDEARKAAS